MKKKRYRRVLFVYSEPVSYELERVVRDTGDDDWASVSDDLLLGVDHFQSLNPVYELSSFIEDYINRLEFADELDEPMGLI